MRLRSVVLSSLMLPGLLAWCAPAARGATDDANYRVPPAVVAQLLTAPRLPRGAPNASPDGAWLAVPDLRSLIPISTLAEPVAKLAGLEVLPEMWANRERTQERRGRADVLSRRRRYPGACQAADGRAAGQRAVVQQG